MVDGDMAEGETGMAGRDGVEGDIGMAGRGMVRGEIAAGEKAAGDIVRGDTAVGDIVRGATAAGDMAGGAAKSLRSGRASACPPGCAMTARSGAGLAAATAPNTALALLSAVFALSLPRVITIIWLSAVWATAIWDRSGNDASSATGVMSAASARRAAPRAVMPCHRFIQAPLSCRILRPPAESILRSG
jgi:hypothetical protein